MTANMENEVPVYLTKDGNGAINIWPGKPKWNKELGKWAGQQMPREEDFLAKLLGGKEFKAGQRIKCVIIAE